MKDLFPGRYKPTTEEFQNLFKSCYFSFDTNVLLNLYGYSDDARADWFKVFNKISERIWLPFQVAKEFQENRLNRIALERQKYDSVSDAIKEIDTKFHSELDKIWKFAPREVTGWKSKISKLVGEASEKVDEYKKAHRDLSSDDEIRAKIDSLFYLKIGRRHTEDFLMNCAKESKARFEKKIPPGFADHKKDSNENGDYILWKELLTYTKEIKKPLIFVTDDKKLDWWEGSRGNIIGPHPELINEFFYETQQKFYLYDANRFLKAAKEHFNKEIKDWSIDETKAMTMSQLAGITIPAITDRWDYLLSSPYQNALSSAADSALSEWAKKESIAEALIGKQNPLYSHFRENKFGLLSNYLTAIAEDNANLNKKKRDTE